MSVKVLKVFLAEQKTLEIFQTTQGINTARFKIVLILVRFMVIELPRKEL